ncbi:integral membrane protein [Stagonosporopsis vannaccii]|nr:integral membrane protein [Stagonosporopsis vannaccii]
MSYSHRQWGVTSPIITTCQNEHWWRQRQSRSDRQRGISPGRSATIPSNQPTAIFDPNEFRLIDPPQRIVDLEKCLQHSHFKTISLSSGSTLLEKTSAPSHQDLPPECYPRIIRRLRYGVFAVYQRLFTFVFLVNLATTLGLLHYHSWSGTHVFTIDNLASLASSNFLISILFRQDWLINLLFRTAWLIPWSSPLWVRRSISRVYCYGGIHSGAAAMGSMWWIAFTFVLGREGVTRGTYTPTILILTLLISSLLMTILVLSLPKLRTRHHDTWELTHRFLGWLSIALFWAQMLLLTHYTSMSSTSYHGFGRILTETPTFYNLTLITLMLVYPWLLLRRWTFTVTPLSSHALQLSFPNKVHKYSCLVLSSSPLREWHPFATFPNPSPRSAHPATTNSLVVSAAGDWTKDLIATAHWKRKEQQVSGVHSGTSVQMQFWVKSHPRAGVLSLSCLYARVVILTTGSGIGPSLSSLLDRPQAQVARLVWSTRSPRNTYGADMLALVEKADPGALILDTDEMGRPDLLQVAYRVYEEMDAEAVFVLSNEKVTRLVVGGLEQRGIPAYGPIWDS